MLCAVPLRCSWTWAKWPRLATSAISLGRMPNLKVLLQVPITCRPTKPASGLPILLSDIMDGFVSFEDTCQSSTTWTRSMLYTQWWHKAYWHLLMDQLQMSRQCCWALTSCSLWLSTLTRVKSLAKQCYTAGWSGFPRPVAGAQALQISPHHPLRCCDSVHYLKCKIKCSLGFDLYDWFLIWSKHVGCGRSIDVC